MSFTGAAPNPDDFTSRGSASADESLLVRFLTRPLQNGVKTAEEGRPIFDEILFIDIRTPGDRDAVVRRATQADLQRFPRHYAAYQQRISVEDVTGTPLVEWPLVTRSQVEELSFANIKTVEQLAGISDANAQGFRGINTLREQAKRWLEEASEKAKTVELQEQLAQRDATIEALESRLSALEAAAPETTSKPKGKKKATKKKE